MSSIEVEDGRNIGAFIPANLDDYGLSPFEFRIYSRLVRRAGSRGGTARESLNSMAKACKICPQVVKSTLKFLCAAGMTVRVKRPGQPSLYRLTPASKWAHPENLDEIRDATSHHPGRIITQVTASPTPQVTSSPTPQVTASPTPQVTTSPRLSRHPGDDVTPYPGDDVTPYPGDDVTPKGTPMKLLPKGLEIRKISNLKTRSQNGSTAVADEAILESEILSGDSSFDQRPEEISDPVKTEILAVEQNEPEDALTPEKSRKKKKETKYLKPFGSDEGMKQDFLAIYEPHLKHTEAAKAVKAYCLLRDSGATAEEILAAHQAAMRDSWKERPRQFQPTLGSWLGDMLVNRELGIKGDRPQILFAEQYGQVRTQYFQVCVELDAPFGDEELAIAMWNAQAEDPRNIDGIVEATPYYLEKKRKRLGEPICLFERYLRHRWQIVLAHKQLPKTNQTPSGKEGNRSFIDWFNLAISARVVQSFSSSDSGITGLPTGSIGVMVFGEDVWKDWRAIAALQPVDRLQQRLLAD